MISQVSMFINYRATKIRNTRISLQSWPRAPWITNICNRSNGLITILANYLWVERNRSEKSQRTETADCILWRRV